MSTFLGLNAFGAWGAVELGLIYALVAMGVYLSFRILDFPDLTVDGSFPLGAAVCAAIISVEWSSWFSAHAPWLAQSAAWMGSFKPWIATFAGAIAGGLAGFITAFISTRFGILHLLASILTMTALMSIILRVMNGPFLSIGGEPTVMTPFLDWGLPNYEIKPIVVGVIVLIVFVLLGGFLRSEAGLAMRATGANPRMAKANGVRPSWHTILGVSLSNAMVGLAGALFAQVNASGDANSGLGTIVAGLAAVIIGETLLPSRRLFVILIGCILGSVLFRLVIAIAVAQNFTWLMASDQNLITSSLILAALILPRYWRRVGFEFPQLFRRFSA